MTVTLGRGISCMPLRRLLERVARIERFRIAPCARDDLQADGQSALGEPAWERQRGQTREIERRSETRQPRGLFDGVVAVDRRRGGWGGGEDQQVA